jgi:hypothetical protein
VAAQTTYYGPGGDYLGQGTWRRNTATFYDATGNFVGSSVASPGRSTNFFGRDGSFQGTLSRTGDSTNFYDRAGRYQGSVTTMPAPASPRTFNLKRRYWNPSGSARGTDQSRSLDWLKFKNPAAPAVRREAEGGLGKAPMTTLTLRMIKGDFIVTGPDVEPSNASPAARPETGAPSTIRHRRLKRSAAAVSGQRGSGLPIADARAGGKARDGEFA